jgi:hypothetical protein
MEALGMEPNDDDDISSVIDSPFQTFKPVDNEPLPDGDFIDSTLTAMPVTDDEPPADRTPATTKSRSRSRSKTPPDSGPREAKAGPPSLDEWTRFFSNVVLRVGTEYYIQLAFRSVDEDALTEREVERLAMTDEEKTLIAVPFAELSNKSKFMRRHGRMIVASGDAFNAAVVLGVWASRVNRIAAKYRPRQPKIQKVTLNGSAGPGTEYPTQEGANGGRIPYGYSGPIFPSGSG